MNQLKLLRLIFQLFCFAIFVYQVQNSVRKYSDKPVTQLTSETTFKEITPPDIYICEEGQFNGTTAVQLGYKTLAKFLLGNLTHGQKKTWNGKTGNLTYKMVQEILFQSSFNNFVYQTSETGTDNDWKRSETELVFKTPQGFCMKPKQMKKGLNFRVTTQSFFAINDPAKQNKLRITAMEHGKFNFGPSGVNTFSGSGYEIKIKIEDATIHDGVSCTQYNRINTTYGECIENGLMNSLVAWYGCLPPWFPAGNKPTCGSDVHITKQNEKEALAEILRMNKGFDLKSSSACLPPCTKMAFEIKQLYYDPNRKELLILKLYIP